MACSPPLPIFSSIATLRLDDSLLRGSIDLGVLLCNGGRRKLAAGVASKFQLLADAHEQIVKALASDRKAAGEAEGTKDEGKEAGTNLGRDLECTVRYLYAKVVDVEDGDREGNERQRHHQKTGGTPHAPPRGSDEKPVRWELPAAFAMFLADVLRKVGAPRDNAGAVKELNARDAEGSTLQVHENGEGSRQFHDHFAHYLVTGSPGTGFPGLVGLLSYGSPEGVEAHATDGPWARVSRLAQKLLTGSMEQIFGGGDDDQGTWFDECVDVVTHECELALMECVDDVVQRLRSVAGMRDRWRATRSALQSRASVDPEESERLLKGLEDARAQVALIPAVFLKLHAAAEWLMQLLDSLGGLVRRLEAVDPQARLCHWLDRVLTQNLGAVVPSTLLQREDRGAMSDAQAAQEFKRFGEQIRLCADQLENWKAVVSIAVELVELGLGEASARQINAKMKEFINSGIVNALAQCSRQVRFSSNPPKRSTANTQSTGAWGPGRGGGGYWSYFGKNPTGNAVTLCVPRPPCNPRVNAAICTVRLHKTPMNATRRARYP